MLLLIVNFFHALHFSHVFYSFFFFFWFVIKSILPKIFGSKRNGRGSDEETLKSSSAEEGDGVTLGIQFMTFFFVYIENLNFHVVRFPLILFYKCFVWKDLENKIETRRKAFLEAAPIMRKSFSGTQMHTFSCDTNTIFTFSEIESTHLIALITIFLQYNIININTYIQNYGFSLH